MMLTELIGTRVSKESGKPFKHGDKLSTVTGLTVNQRTQLPAFTFAEHDTVVDCHQCVTERGYKIKKVEASHEVLPSLPIPNLGDTKSLECGPDCPECGGNGFIGGDTQSMWACTKRVARERKSVHLP